MKVQGEERQGEFFRSHGSIDGLGMWLIFVKGTSEASIGSGESNLPAVNCYGPGSYSKEASDGIFTGHYGWVQFGQI